MKKFRYIGLITSSLTIAILLAAYSNANKSKYTNMNMDMNHSEKEPSQSGTVAGQNKNLIYTDNESGTVSIIDAASYKVIGTINDEGTQVSPDGKAFAYILKC